MLAAEAVRYSRAGILIIDIEAIMAATICPLYE